MRITTLTGADIERGQMQVRASLRTFADCLASGRWPGPGGDRRDAEYLALPAWAAKRIDTELELKPHAKKQQLLNAMHGHVLAEASLMGTYQRRR